VPPVNIKIKKSILLAAVAVCLLCGFLLSLRPATPEARFRSLFTDLSIGVPAYQNFYRFDRPSMAIKGDFFALEFGQSEPQFLEFATRLGMAPVAILSATGALIRAESKTEPKYPWVLTIKAERANSASNTYQIHIEGRQSDD
jgi:hypothetical protein